MSATIETQTQANPNITTGERRPSSILTNNPSFVRSNSKAYQEQKKNKDLTVEKKKTYTDFGNSSRKIKLTGKDEHVSILSFIVKKLNLNDYSAFRSLHDED
jgi:hypothetical protein